MTFMDPHSRVLADTGAKRCLVISGSVHGNEPVGKNAMKQLEALVASGDWKIEGIDIFGIIGNPAAIEKNVRFVEENLNRAFYPHTTENLESRRAAEISMWMDALAAQYSEIYWIDLHSVSLGETRIIIYDADITRSKEFALAISPIPFRLGVRESVLPGSLIGAGMLRGFAAVSIECGNHVSEDGINVAMEHIERALEYLNALKSQTTTFKNTVSYEGEPRTYEMSDRVAPEEYFAWTKEVYSEMPLKKDEVFAHGKSGDHAAPYECYMIMPAKHPEPTDTDAGFLALKI